MGNWKDNLTEHGYQREHLDLADDFVSLVASLLEEDPAHADRIRRGIDALAPKMNTLFPEIEEADQDELIGGITPDELRDVMSPIDDEAIAVFIAVSGAIMLSGHDGPMASALPMKRVVDEYLQKRGLG